ncbi:methylated-DNA--[protein]-cysteine S-methyltransferase [Streptacidiphilus sp. 4-A2]|nr:methylated-DNA--[protein]-cysteine S-methyltransferase [Streptacidiphilus sp. 4-A2]
MPQVHTRCGLGGKEFASEAKASGGGSTVSTAVSWFSVPTPLPSGAVRVAITDEGVAAATFGAGPDLPDLVRPGDEPRVKLVAQRFAEYFAGTRRDLELPLDWRRTAVGPQRSVLSTLQRTVGYGQTLAYGELAVRSELFTAEIAAGQLGQAARAVGSIMGTNPLFLLVPCHRVVAADGLGGYGGGELGMEVKRWLLTLEGGAAAHLRLERARLSGSGRRPETADQRPPTADRRRERKTGDRSGVRAFWPRPRSSRWCGRTAPCPAPRTSSPAPPPGCRPPGR